MIDTIENLEAGRAAARRRRKNQSRIDRLCREAKAVGLSYGYYVGMTRAGFAVASRSAPRPYRDPHHSAWIEELLIIANRG